MGVIVEKRELRRGEERDTGVMRRGGGRGRVTSLEEGGVDRSGC